VSCTVIFLFFSFAIPIALGLMAYGASWTKMGPWDLGGPLFRLVAVASILSALFIFFIGVQPPNGWALWITVGFVILAAIIWVAFEQRRFQGPPIGDMIASARPKSPPPKGRSARPDATRPSRPRPAFEKPPRGLRSSRVATSHHAPPRLPVMLNIKTRESSPTTCAKKDLGFIKVGVFDIDGIMRGKYMGRDKFLSSLDKGYSFCDVVLGWDSNDQLYDNVSLTGWHTAYPDAAVRLLPETTRSSLSKTTCRWC